LGSNSGVKEYHVQILKKFAKDQGEVSKEFMQLLWFLKERTQNRNNSADWDPFFVELFTQFITKDQPLHQKDCERLKDIIMASDIFEASVKEDINKALENRVSESAELQLPKKNNLFRTPEINEGNPEDLATSTDRCLFVISVAALVDHLREIKDPTVKYTHNHNRTCLSK